MVRTANGSWKLAAEMGDLDPDPASERIDQRLDYDSPSGANFWYQASTDPATVVATERLQRQYARRFPHIEERYQDLKLQVALLKARVKELEEKRDGRVFSNASLPFELWQMVFTFATEVHSFTSPSIGDSLENRNLKWKESLRLRKAIVQVCSTWRQAGRRFLFEHIVLTQIPQLAGIVRILEQSSCDRLVGRWVKTIKMHFIITPNWLRFYSLHLVRLIRCCPKSTSFISEVTYDDLNYLTLRHFNLSQSIFDGLLEIGRSPLVTLDISKGTSVKISTLVSIGTNLKYLSLGIIELDNKPITIHMPHLEDLNIPFTCTLKLPYVSVTTLSTDEFRDDYNLVLPSLRSFGGVVGREKGAFLLQHGNRLTSLNFLSWDAQEGPSFLKDILDPCPHLLHLAFNLQHVAEVGTLLSDGANVAKLPAHPLLSHIAIGNFLPTEMTFIRYDSRTYQSLSQPKCIDSLFRILTAEAFPALQRIWTVDDNVDGVIDPYPLPWKTHQLWKKWLPYWKVRGVRVENKEGESLRFYRIDWKMAEDPIVEDDDDSLLTDDESSWGLAVSIHRPRSLIVSDDGSDRGYRYSRQRDVEISVSDEEEGWEVDEPTQDSVQDIDEEMALQIFDRMVKV